MNNTCHICLEDIAYLQEEIVKMLDEKEIYSRENKIIGISIQCWREENRAIIFDQYEK